MSSRNNYIDAALYDYILANSLRDTPLLARLREETAAMPGGMMQISPDQGQFMALLVRLTGAARILEIGSFTGYSALVMAQALPESGRLTACDVSEEYTSTARRYWQEAGVAGKIDLRLGPAADTLSALLGDGAAGSYDLAFIDADKINYGLYFESCLELLRPGRTDPDRQRALERAPRARRRRWTRIRWPSASSTPPSTATSASTCRCCRSGTA